MSTLLWKIVLVALICTHALGSPVPSDTPVTGSDSAVPVPGSATPGDLDSANTFLLGYGLGYPGWGWGSGWGGWGGYGYRGFYGRPWGLWQDTRTTVPGNPVDSQIDTTFRRLTCCLKDLDCVCDYFGPSQCFTFFWIGK